MDVDQQALVVKHPVVSTGKVNTYVLMWANLIKYAKYR